MKTLILMRHGKAEKLTHNTPDFERNLEDRGKKDAANMAHLLSQTKYIPELIIASPANRTKQTAHILSKELSIKNIELDTQIYEAEISDLMHVLRETNDQYNTIALVGHNPSITVIVGYLSNTYLEHVPTSGIVVVELATDTWRLTQARIGKLVWQKNPKGLYHN